MALVVLACLAGCGTTKNYVPRPVSVSGQERNFAGALEYLRSGNEQRARELLERVVEAAPVNGITDEALFRLALLQLRDEGGRGAAQTQLLLERLADEYPNSNWTRQAAPLSIYLSNVKNLRDRQRELKTLRDLNLSLSRDNRELRQTIERLKSLDLELEQKIKR
jgi:thioredoxin-like negative regulator of GroEL